MVQCTTFFSLEQPHCEQVRFGVDCVRSVSTNEYYIVLDISSIGHPGFFGDEAKSDLLGQEKMSGHCDDINMSGLQRRRVHGHDMRLVLYLLVPLFLAHEGQRLDGRFGPCTQFLDQKAPVEIAFQAPLARAGCLSCDDGSFNCWGAAGAVCSSSSFSSSASSSSMPIGP